MRTLLLSLLGFAYLGTVSARPHLCTIEKDIVKGGTTYKCTFNIQHDDEKSAIDIKKSSVECSPTALLPERVDNVELEDDEGHIFMVDFQISPDGIIQGEYEGLTPQEEFEALGVEEKKDDVHYPCSAHDPRLDDEVRSTNITDTDRGAHNDRVSSWPNGIIPYVFDYTFNRQDRLTFAKATQQIEANTCVRFRARRSEKKWLKVLRQCNCGARTGPNCFGGGFATLGAWSPSKLTIGAACMTPDSSSAVKLMAHEILHNLGIGHTQTRPDRDNYIWIYTNNIQPSGRSQWKKCSFCKTHGTPYDCHSIMHYRDWAFAINSRKPVMVSKNKRTCDVSSPAHYLTKADNDLINAIYRCQGSKPTNGGWSFWSAWSTCSSRLQYRFRLCNKPKPANGGKNCYGKAKETRTCSTTTGGDGCPLLNKNTKGRINRRVADEVESWKDCANICAKMKGCTYWTWHHERGDAAYRLRCVLMDGKSSLVTDENAISGSVSCAEPIEKENCPEKDVNTRGRGHSQKLRTNSWKDCAQVCKKIPFCTDWTWHHKDAGWYYKRCIIMAGYGNKVEDTNAISGSKKCLG